MNTTIASSPTHFLEVGVDVSKATLDVFFEDQAFTIPNSLAGVRQLLKQLHALDFYSEPGIRAEIKREINALTKRIESYQKKLAELIANDEQLQSRHQAMQTISGVGPATANTLLIHFPELGNLNRKQAAALAGLAPMNRDSGAGRGKRTIQAGRAEPRKALYMAAVTASFKNPMFMDFYQQLRSRGKPAKVALIAVARKLLILLNTTLKKLNENHAPTSPQKP